ncbi:MAG: ferrous iron transport protein A [Acidaminococcales bacterium]|jgi:ferrous iron transport protein A|nr:ferrous iron transport protein A [Acidaminococcales bacterium]
MEKTLAQFKPGETGRVSKVTGEGMVKRRLFDMGITPGTEICLRKTAPLGDPLELRVRGYGLSIRKAEALSVLMSPAKVN